MSTEEPVVFSRNSFASIRRNGFGVLVSTNRSISLFDDCCPLAVEPKRDIETIPYSFLSTSMCFLRAATHSSLRILSIFCAKIAIISETTKQFQIKSRKTQIPWHTILASSYTNFSCKVVDSSLIKIAVVVVALLHGQRYNKQQLLQRVLLQYLTLIHPYG